MKQAWEACATVRTCEIESDNFLICPSLLIKRAWVYRALTWDTRKRSCCANGSLGHTILGHRILFKPDSMETGLYVVSLQSLETTSPPWLNA